MDIFLLLTVIVTSAIQSLFGVGVLLFGTPILLLLDYSFFESLMVLLPVSASINLFQIIKGYNDIDKEIYKGIILITVPFIVVSLYLLSKFNINISIIVGVFLVIIALKEYMDGIKIFIKKLLNYNKLFYTVMGIVHGMTNLGGALLTAKVFTADLNKYEKRATIAASYMTFAIFQIFTIYFLSNNYNWFNLIYIIVGLFVYFLINKLFFSKITNNKYDKIFAIFLLISGGTLVIKGII